MRIDWLGKAWAYTMPGRDDATMATMTVRLQRVFDGERFIASVLLMWESGSPVRFARGRCLARANRTRRPLSIRRAYMDIRIAYCGA